MTKTTCVEGEGGRAWAGPNRSVNVVESQERNIDQLLQPMLCRPFSLYRPQPSKVAQEVSNLAGDCTIRRIQTLGYVGAEG